MVIGDELARKIVDTGRPASNSMRYFHSSPTPLVCETLLFLVHFLPSLQANSAGTHEFRNPIVFSLIRRVDLPGYPVRVVRNKNGIKNSSRCYDMLMLFHHGH
jgi:hypothetical protein